MTLMESDLTALAARLGESLRYLGEQVSGGILHRWRHRRGDHPHPGEFGLVRGWLRDLLEPPEDPPAGGARVAVPGSRRGQSGSGRGHGARRPAAQRSAFRGGGERCRRARRWLAGKAGRHGLAGLGRRRAAGQRALPVQRRPRRRAPADGGDRADRPAAHEQRREPGLRACGQPFGTFFPSG